MENIEAIKYISHLEQVALEPYNQAVSGNGLSISFKPCSKKLGANVKKGSRWGKLEYSDYKGDNVDRNGAIKSLCTSSEFRRKYLTMRDKKLCAICSRNETQKEKLGLLRRWGWLKYLEHDMDICPECIKKIYNNSYKPWVSN